MNGKLKDLAEKVQTLLLNAGFIVHRYDAYSTNSIYLKLDYGVGNSIRISDHMGKQHLHYRFNLADVDEYTEDKSGKYPRFIFPYRSYKQMVNRIVGAKEYKLSLYGEYGHQERMKRYKREAKNEKGFWQQAKQIRQEGSDGK